MNVSVIKAIVPAHVTAVLQRTSQTASILHLLVVTAHRVVATCALPLWQRIETFLSVSTIELLVSISTWWEHCVCLDAASGSSLCCCAPLWNRNPTRRVHAHPIIN